MFDDGPERLAEVFDGIPDLPFQIIDAFEIFLARLTADSIVPGLSIADFHLGFMILLREYLGCVVLFIGDSFASPVRFYWGYGDVPDGFDAGPRCFDCDVGTVLLALDRSVVGFWRSLALSFFCHLERDLVVELILLLLLHLLDRCAGHCGLHLIDEG